MIIEQLTQIEGKELCWGQFWHEATVSDWQTQIQLVNEFIRTQEHVDVAREMAAADGTLPSQLAIDGLHLDVTGKQKIATVINENWPRIAGQFQ